jgi:nicotinamide-nucleotide amidase
MTVSILPELQKHFTLPVILHRTLLTAGIGESFLAEHIQEFESGLPQHIKLAYLPNYGMLRLRLTATGDKRDILGNEIDTAFAELKKSVAEWMVIDEDLSMSQAVGKLLKQKNQTLATAESCTGGYIAHLLTLEPGASNYFNGSIISYTNEIKERVLLVHPETINLQGAVSEGTVKEMASGALALLNTDFVIATSGIMGPDGGSIEKPVGLVWVAVGSREKIIAQKFNFRFGRERNIELTATNALNLLRKFILAEI